MNSIAALSLQGNKPIQSGAATFWSVSGEISDTFDNVRRGMSLTNHASKYNDLIIIVRFCYHY